MKPPETVYRGERLCGPRGEVLGVRVTVTAPGGHERLLSPQPSQKIRNHSPCGFEWGYCGSGPHQTALAILLDATGDRELSERHYNQFTWAVVVMWGDRWEITAGKILEWVARFQRETSAEEKGYERVVLISAEEGGAP